GQLRMAAPPSADGTWSHVSALPAGHPARAAFRTFGAAWRAGDAAAVNSAALEIAAALPQINPEQYPTTRRAAEAVYNASHPFEFGAWAYFFSLLALLLAFATGRR